MDLKWEIPADRLIDEIQITGVPAEAIDPMMDKVASRVESEMGDQAGMPVNVTRGRLVSNHLFKEPSETPMLLVESTSHQEYAKIVLSFKRVGAVLDFKAGQYGSTSGNYQKVQAHKLFANKEAAEEEDMFYSCLVGAAEAAVRSMTE